MNRIEPELSKLQRISDPNFLMREIVDLLDTSFPPESGKYYIYYRAKTPNIAYDRHPLVEVVDAFNWDFVALIIIGENQDNIHGMKY